MPRYRFTQTYRSSYGAGDRDQVIELDETQAANINRDAPGTLEPVAETRAPDAPPHDRQIARAPQKRTARDG